MKGSFNIFYRATPFQYFIYTPYTCSGSGCL